jgi:glycosyltransferase involved in cell wall biosynthesis
MVPNGVPLKVYTFVPEVPADAPFVFLGRIEEIKGPHLAIELARMTNTSLVIAGNVPAEHQAWFDKHIAPQVDGKQIRFVGPVDDAQKNELLGSARAFLMPILWDEPFGIVMAEAMACGTPVLALKRGAAAEVVEDGITGFVTDTVGELVAKSNDLWKIDRLACRRRVESRFSAEAVVDGYLSVYERMVKRSR